MLLSSLAPGLTAAPPAKGDVLPVLRGVHTTLPTGQGPGRPTKLKVADAHSKGVKHFPTPAELDKTSLVVLSDTSGGEFTPDQVGRLKAYVKRGGGLLVLGGPFALGLGQFAENGLAEALPVTLTPRDLKWEKAGRDHRQGGRAPNAPRR